MSSSKESFSKRDKELGMNRNITRRDFLNGVAVTAGALTLGQHLNFHALAQGSTNQGAKNYPPSATGLQGQTDASQTVMHAVRDGSMFDFGSAMPTGETYDLVVVGAGISGLAAAYLYRQQMPGARVLIVDPLEDFGGHAKRNEFEVNGKTVIGYGGSQTLQTPTYFSAAVNKLLSDIAIDLPKFETYFDQAWSEDRGLAGGLFFPKEVWGEDVMVRRDGDISEWIQKTPMTEKAKQDLITFVSDPPDYLAGMTREEKFEFLSRTTYKDFLLNVVKADPQLVTYFQTSTTGYFGVGIDGTTCLDAWGNYNPGFDGMDLGDVPYKTMSPSGRLALTDPDPYIHHFPDGNAGVARALVRALIPDALPGATMEDLVTTPVDYSKLDGDTNDVRIRLSSSVLRVKHNGNPESASDVEIIYADSNGLHSVSAGHIVLACWHRVIPYLTDEISTEQRLALNDQHKVPLMYNNVVLKNWQAFDKLKIDRFAARGHYWPSVSIDFPVSMGSYQFAQTPDDPVVLHFSKVVVNGDSTSARDQARAGRYELAETPFEELERSMRDLLARALSGGDFDPAEDIAAITINRWSHGYAYEYMRPWDAFWPDGPLPIEMARQPWGRIAIANADSGAYAYAHSAIDQAVRAVRDLLGSPEGAPEFATFPGPPRDKLGL
jgi:spermidine dehydrogenase